MGAPRRKLSGDPECKNGTCLTLWGTADGKDYVVQGYVITDPERLAQFDLPEGDGSHGPGRRTVLRSPLTDYLRYELSACPGNIRAGESIGIIDLPSTR